MSAIEVKALNKSFQKGFIPQKISVLKNVEFTVNSGRITGFLGGNGAGKTTTLKCLLDLIFPNSGHISFLDGNPFQKIKNKVGYLPEHPYFYDYLTGMEFLRFYGELSNLKRQDIKERSLKLLKKVKLEHAKDRLLRAYSKGMLQKIGLAQALIHNPELVILDEPLSGLDPDGRASISEIIHEISSEGVTLFFSSHLLHDVETLCEDLVILKDGSVFYQGTLNGFISTVNENYLITLANGEIISTQSLDELQEKIKQIQNNNGLIVDCRKKTSNLEEVFKDRALK